MVDCCSHEGPDSGDARFDIETDDGVIIVDTHSKPSAARAIIERLRDLTTKPVRYVINTHFHWDHWHGNEAYPAAYPGAEIVTNQITREAMLRKGLKRIQDHVRQVPGEIARLKAELAAVGTPAHRATIESDLRLAEAYLAEVTALPAGAAHHRLRADHADLPARPGDPPPAPGPRPHRGRRLRLPAEGDAVVS